MTSKTVSVRLMAEVAQYKARMNEAGAATKGLATEVSKAARVNRQELQSIGTAAAATGAGLVALSGAAVTTAANFEQAMSSVRAATHAPQAEFDRLREAAIKAGADTAFSASEAALGIEEMAKAGVATADVLSGGLSGALDLAAAGTIGVGDAAELAATAMTQFKLSGDQIPHVADLLAAAAGKAQGGVHDMGMALKQSGLIASQSGLSIEETTAGLAAFASAGLLGSDAGTSFKTMLQRLVPQSADAATAMEEIGFSAYDAQGNFIGLEAVAGQLKAGLTGLTEEQRAATMTTIFGSDAVRAAAVLYEQGAEGVRHWTEQVNDAGYAQETAAIKLDNLKGDLEALGGSLETALIGSGTAAANWSRGAVQAATDVVNAYSALPDPLQSGAAAFAGIGGAALLAAGGMAIAAPRIVDTRDAMRTMRTEMPRTSAAMRGLGRAAGGLAVLGTAATAAALLSDALTDGAPGMERTAELLESMRAGGRGLDEIFAGNRSGVDSFVEALTRIEGKQGGLKGLVDDLSLGMNVNLRSAKADIEAIDQALAKAVQSGNAEVAAQQFEAMAARIQGTGIGFADLVNNLPAYQEALAGVRNETVNAATATTGLDGAAAGMTATIGEGTGAAEEQTAALEALSDALDSLLAGAFDVEKAQDALTGAYGDFADQVAAAKEAGDKNAASLRGNSDAALANREAVRGVVERNADLVQAWAESGMSSENLEKRVDRQKRRLREALEQMGFSRAEARKYADQLDDIKAQVKTTISTPGMDRAQSDVDALARKINSLTDKRISIDVAYSLLNQEAAQANRMPGRTGVRRNTGGPINGPGSGTSDDVLIWASNGEYMQKTAAVDYYGVDTMEALNNMRIPKSALKSYATGGPIVTLDTSSQGLDSGLSSMASAMMGGAQDFMAKMATFDSSSGWPPAVMGKVSPNTAAAVNFVRENWGISNIGTLGSRPNKSDHPMGKALDVMIANWQSRSGNNLGDAIATWFTANADAFGTKYVIWDDQINSGSGWRRYTHPNGPTSNPTLRHQDHVHVSLRDQGGPVYPGWNMIYNGTGQNEWVNTAAQQKKAMQLEGVAGYARGGLVKKFASGGLVGVPRGYGRNARDPLAPGMDASALLGLAGIPDASEVNRLWQERNRLMQEFRRVQRDSNSTIREEIAAKRALNRATQAAVRTEREFRTGATLTAFSSTTGRGNRATAAFQKDLQKVAARGFGDLAEALFDLGGAEGAQVAARASRASKATLRKIAAQVDWRRGLDTIGENMPQGLAVLSAVAGRGNRRTSLDDIAQTTGMSLEELADVVPLVTTQLKSMGSAGRSLVSDLSAWRRGDYVTVSGLSSRNLVTPPPTLSPTFRIYLGDQPIDNLISVQIDGMGRGMATSYAAEAPHHD